MNNYNKDDRAAYMTDTCIPQYILSPSVVMMNTKAGPRIHRRPQQQFVPLHRTLLTMLLLFRIADTFGFVPIATKTPRSLHVTTTTTVMTRLHIPDLSVVTATTETGSSFSIDSIRQYIPLGVSVLVIIDILLGSPVANGILNQLRPATTDTTNKGSNNDATTRESPNNNIPLSKERIDSQKVAQDAIQRARYTLELRAFLDAQRDPVVELQRKMDQQAADLERNQNNLQAALQQQQQQQRSNNDSTKQN